MKRIDALRWATPLALVLLGAFGPAQALTANDLLTDYSARAGAQASAERGQKFFTTNFGRALGFSCSSCHGSEPTTSATDQITEKNIAPLAPAANAKRFTDRAKVDHMFRVNCKDVVGRECSAQEKADVLAWLVSLKP